MSVTYETKLDAVWAYIKELESSAKNIHATRILITCHETSAKIRDFGRGYYPGSRRRKQVEYTQRRSAGDNVTIFRTQAKRGRNPAFLDERENDKMVAEWSKGMQLAENGDRLALRKAAHKMGSMFVGFIRDHITRGRSIKGTMRPLKSVGPVYVARDGKIAHRMSYQEKKDKLYPGKPILVKSGQLRRSLTYKIKEVF